MKNKWVPLFHQKKVVKFGLKNSVGALFLQPGLGKTSISLAIIKMLLKEKIIPCALVVAPLRVCYSVWPVEAKKWSDFEHMKVQIIHGKDKEFAFNEEADIYVTNPDTLEWLMAQGTKFLKAKFGGAALFIDESTGFKNTQSQRFKILKSMLNLFARRYILTGTPMPNTMEDLFGQIYILDGGKALGQYITHYRNKFFHRSGYNLYEWSLNDGADKEIQKAIKPYTIRMEAEDYIDLPKEVVNNIEFSLEPKAMKIYKEMEREMIASLESGEVSAATAAVASMKCAQIANGGLYDEDRNVLEVHLQKAEICAELVDELNGSPALIAYEFEHDLQRLLKVFGKNTPYIGGGVSPKKSLAIVEAWNEGKIPVLLGHPAAMGHGLNLQQSGNTIIWHSITWNYEHYEQFNRRIRRQGSQHAQVFIHHIVAKDTVDELKLMALNRKYRTQADLFSALKSLYLKRK